MAKPKSAPVRFSSTHSAGVSLQTCALGAVIVIATLFAYLPAIRGDYIWDDESYITNNTVLRDLDGLRKIWIPEQTPQYYPVVFTMFWVEYHLWQLRPMGYHLVNVLLHIANALLIWRLVWRLGFPGRDAPVSRDVPRAIGGPAISASQWLVGWLTALVFALHPVHVESVAWITERKNVLSGLFYLVAALAYLRFDEWQFETTSPAHRTNAWLWYGGSLLLFVMALLSKSVTCSLPAALILMLLWQRRTLTWFRLAPLMPMFVIGLLLALNTARIERDHVGAEGPNWDFSIADRVLIASKSLLFYPWKIIWPTNLIFVYPRWVIDDHNWRQYWSVAVVLVIAIVLLTMYLRGRRGAPLAIAFFAGTIFPALGFFNVYPMLFSFVADHFQYLASLGIIVAIFGSMCRVIRSERLLIIMGLALTPLLGILTWSQALMYTDIETLWLVTIDRNDQAWMPRNNLASHYLRAAELAQGDPEDAEAIQHWAHQAEIQSRAAIAIKPDHISSWTNLSEALRLQNQFPEALSAAKTSLELAVAAQKQSKKRKLDIAENHWNIGRLLQLLNQPERAIAEYTVAAQLNPHYHDAHVELALLLLNAQRFDDAIPHIEQAIATGLTSVRFLVTAGQRLDQAGRYADAAKYYRQAFAAARSNSEKADSGYFLLQLLAMCPDHSIRKGDEAVRIGEQILDLSDRNKPLVLGALAAAYAESGRFADAVRTQEQAVQLAHAAGAGPLVDVLQHNLDAFRAGMTAP